MSAPPIRVLLIENVAPDAELARRAFLKETDPPFDVEWVDTLQAGLKRLAAGGIDIIVLDLGLPDSHGIETFTRIYEQSRDVPIVILTGSYMDDATAVKAVKAGAQDYLTKDLLDGKMLPRLLRYAIERKRIEVELHVANLRLKTKLDEVAWLNRITMELENENVDLKQEIRTLRQALEKQTDGPG